MPSNRPMLYVAIRAIYNRKFEGFNLKVSIKEISYTLVMACSEQYGKSSSQRVRRESSLHLHVSRTWVELHMKTFENVSMCHET